MKALMFICKLDDIFIVKSLGEEGEKRGGKNTVTRYYL